MQRPGGHGHYDPNQPRVPAGDPRGGQFASKGYRGGGSGRDARVMPASLDAAQLTQLGYGNPRDANAQAQPFDGQLGEIDAGQHLNSRRAFVQAANDSRRNPHMRDFVSSDGRYKFVSTGPAAEEPTPGGVRWIISSTTYAYDDTMGAYATISATPARPIIITSTDDGKLVVTPVNVRFNNR